MKTVLITGSTDGIGKQTAIELARKEYHVFVHGRNNEKAKTVASEIKELTGNSNVEYVDGDFSSLQQVRSMAKDLHQRTYVLDILINNAGIYLPHREMSDDGYEIQFEVNHLSPFLLTNLLTDLLKKSDQGRVIVVSSMMHSGNLDLDNLQGEKHYNGTDAYSRSKLLNLLFAYKLADKLNEYGITVNALHPGAINTKMLRSMYSGAGSSPETGAETPVYLADSDEVNNVTGKYFVHKRPVSSSSASHDKSLQDKVWKISERLSGLTG
jgi:NAD(P)-dependent dehydrogenase (short-subunit alcohol dehydrogenase family)